MKILNQTQINYKSTCKPGFTSNYREVTDKAGNRIYCNNTWYYRYDLPWNNFIEKLAEKYKDVDKVHIYDYACSEGAEPFSLAMLLIKKLGEEKAQKFLPIIASDLDEEILKNPKQGIIKPSKSDINAIKKILGDDYSKFIEFDDKFEDNRTLKDELCSGKIKPILKNAVIFKNANVINDIPNIEKENSVVMCRNVWLFFNEKEKLKLAEALSNQLGDSSMCVIGNFDDSRSILLSKQFDKYFLNEKEKSGLYSEGLCYIKNSSKEKEHLRNPNFLMKIFGNLKQPFQSKR